MNSTITDEGTQYQCGCRLKFNAVNDIIGDSLQIRVTPCEAHADIQSLQMHSCYAAMDNVLQHVIGLQPSEDK